MPPKCSAVEVQSCVCVHQIRASLMWIPTVIHYLLPLPLPLKLAVTVWKTGYTLNLVLFITVLMCRGKLTFTHMGNLQSPNNLGLWGKSQSTKKEAMQTHKGLTQSAIKAQFRPKIFKVCLRIKKPKHYVHQQIIGFSTVYTLRSDKHHRSENTDLMVIKSC